MSLLTVDAAAYNGINDRLATHEESKAVSPPLNISTSLPVAELVKDQAILVV